VAITASVLVARHRQVYDGLAAEYDRRVAVLAEVNERTAVWFASHLLPGSRLLDVGCGPGAAVQTYARLGFATTGIDISKEMIDRARRRSPQTDFVVGDVMAHSFPGNFGAVHAFAFLHLFPAAEVPVVLARLRRLLMPYEGRMLVSTTWSAESSEGVSAKADFQELPQRFRKHWRREEWETALTTAGFAIVSRRDVPDPFGKLWMNLIVRRDPS
jgi:ubiquinone/menaquinone biosynthesis C-methylase UbiE